MKIWGWRPLLAWHGPVQSNLVLHDLVQHFICEFRTTLNTSAPNIKVLHSNKYGNHTGLKEQDTDK
jgi:hypothetical protein